MALSSAEASCALLRVSARTHYSTYWTISAAVCGEAVASAGVDAPAARSCAPLPAPPAPPPLRAGREPRARRRPCPDWPDGSRCPGCTGIWARVVSEGPRMDRSEKDRTERWSKRPIRATGRDEADQIVAPYIVCTICVMGSCSCGRRHPGCWVAGFHWVRWSLPHSPCWVEFRHSPYSTFSRQVDATINTGLSVHLARKR
jgi:hypothetical protein